MLSSAFIYLFVFLSVFLSFFLSVCLSVFYQDYAKTTERILTKFSPHIQFSLRNNPLNFGGDPAVFVCLLAGQL